MKRVVLSAVLIAASVSLASCGSSGQSAGLGYVFPKTPTTATYNLSNIFSDLAGNSYSFVGISGTVHEHVVSVSGDAARVSVDYSDVALFDKYGNTLPLNFANGPVVSFTVDRYGQASGIQSYSMRNVPSSVTSSMLAFIDRFRSDAQDVYPTVAGVQATTGYTWFSHFNSPVSGHPVTIKIKNVYHGIVQGALEITGKGTADISLQTSGGSIRGTETIQRKFLLDPKTHTVNTEDLALSQKLTQGSTTDDVSYSVELQRQ